MKCSLLSLSSYLDEELEASRRGELEAHLVGCQRCTLGLEHLHEEVERISGLAPVHVPDHSARALMEQLGLLEPGDPLPGRASPRRASPPTVAGLPWLNSEAGKALPWRAERRPVMDERADPRPAPAPDRPPPSPPVIPAAPAAPGLPGVAFMPRQQSVVPPLPAPSPAASSEPTAATADATHPADAPASPAPTLPRPAPPPPASPAPAFETPASPAFASPTPSIEAPESSPPIWTPPPSEPPASPTPTIAPPMSPASPISATGPLDAWTIPAPLNGLDATRPAPDHGTAIGPHLAGVAGASEPAAAPELPAEPEDRAAPGLIDRLRERWAVQRALSRTPREAENDGIEVAPAPGPRMWSRRHRMSGSPRPGSRRASEAVTSPRPALSGAGEIPEPLGWIPSSYSAERARGDAGGEHLSAGSSGRHLDRVRARRGTAAQRGPAGRPAVEALVARLRVPAGSRPLVILGGVLVVIVVFALTLGRAAPPIRHTVPSTAARSTEPGSVPPPPSSAAAPSAAPAVAPPGTTAVQLTDVTTLGSGGAGAQVKGFRYGNHPGSFFRVVVDVEGAGGADAAPRTTVGFKDPTTLWLVFDGATPAAGMAQPGDGSTVVSTHQVSPAPAGKTIYELKLARPVTVNDEYLTSPLRLVLDLH